MAEAKLPTLSVTRRLVVYREPPAEVTMPVRFAATIRERRALNSGLARWERIRRRIWCGIEDQGE
jgi:hypothetical protein